VAGTKEPLNETTMNRYALPWP